MSTEFEDLVRRLWQCVWIDGRLDDLVDVVADPYIRHTRDGTATMTRSAYATHISDVTKTFRGTEVEFADITAVGDRVYARLTLTGVNITVGNSVKINWLAHYRIAEGRIAESWTLHESDADW